MIHVEIATEEMFDGIYPLLELFNNPRTTREQWKSLFAYTWPTEEKTRGFVLMDGERIVGFQGATFSERTIGGRKERFCNLNTWIVLPEYRPHSLLLFERAADIQGATLTALTPGKTFDKLYRMFGFQPLDDALRILFPVPSFRHLGSLLAFRATTNPKKIAGRLDPEDRNLFQHHLPHQCRHLLVYGGSEYCYVIFTRMKGRRFWFANVHYISNKALFLRDLDRIRLRLCLAARAPLVMVPSRFLGNQPIPRSKTAALPNPKLYRSATVAPAEIDNLYTEMILLDI